MQWIVDVDVGARARCCSLSILMLLPIQSVKRSERHLNFGLLQEFLLEVFNRLLAEVESRPWHGEFLFRYETRPSHSGRHERLGN